MKLWLIGRWHRLTWEVQGLFTDEDVARESAEVGWFLVELEADRVYPDDGEWETEYLTPDGWVPIDGKDE